jgi:ElaB/YqjD/DUF883 family membrane-anchored ribosome-binding protein
VDSDTSPSRPPVSDNSDPEQIREEIQATREQLGDTVEALAAKTDVKAQAKQKLDETKESVSAKTDDLLGKARQISPDTAASAATGVSQKARENPLPVAAFGAFALGFLVGRLSSR